MNSSIAGLRYSLLHLVIVVAFVGLACAAATQPRGVWWDLWHGAVFGVLIFSIPAIIYRDGEAKAFWIGFAVFGWMIVAIGRFQLDGRPPIDRRIQQIIATHCADFFRDEAISAAKDSIARGNTIFGGADADSILANQTNTELATIMHYFFDTVWKLFILLSAMAGGILTRALYFSRHQSNRSIADR